MEKITDDTLKIWKKFKNIKNRVKIQNRVNLKKRVNFQNRVKFRWYQIRVKMDKRKIMFNNYIQRFEGILKDIKDKKETVNTAVAVEGKDEPELGKKVGKQVQDEKVSTKKVQVTKNFSIGTKDATKKELEGTGKDTQDKTGTLEAAVAAEGIGNSKLGKKDRLKQKQGKKELFTTDKSLFTTDKRLFTKDKKSLAAEKSTLVTKDTLKKELEGIADGTVGKTNSLDGKKGNKKEVQHENNELVIKNNEPVLKNNKVGTKGTFKKESAGTTKNIVELNGTVGIQDIKEGIAAVDDKTVKNVQKSTKIYSSLSEHKKYLLGSHKLINKLTQEISHTISHTFSHKKRERESYRSDNTTNKPKFLRAYEKIYTKFHEPNFLKHPFFNPTHRNFKSKIQFICLFYEKYIGRQFLLHKTHYVKRLLGIILRYIGKLNIRNNTTNLEAVEAVKSTETGKGTVDKATEELEETKSESELVKLESYSTEYFEKKYIHLNIYPETLFRNIRIINLNTLINISDINKILTDLDIKYNINDRNDNNNDTCISNGCKKFKKHTEYTRHTKHTKQRQNLHKCKVELGYIPVQTPTTNIQTLESQFFRHFKQNNLTVKMYPKFQQNLRNLEKMTTFFIPKQHLECHLFVGNKTLFNFLAVNHNQIKQKTLTKFNNHFNAWYKLNLKIRHLMHEKLEIQPNERYKLVLNFKFNELNPQITPKFQNNDKIFKILLNSNDIETKFKIHTKFQKEIQRILKFLLKHIYPIQSENILNLHQFAIDYTYNKRNNNNNYSLNDTDISHSNKNTIVSNNIHIYSDNDSYLLRNINNNSYLFIKYNKHQLCSNKYSDNISNMNSNIIQKLNNKFKIQMNKNQLAVVTLSNLVTLVKNKDESAFETREESNKSVKIQDIFKDILTETLYLKNIENIEKSFSKRIRAWLLNSLRNNNYYNQYETQNDKNKLKRNEYNIILYSHRNSLNSNIFIYLLENIDDSYLSIIYYKDLINNNNSIYKINSDTLYDRNIFKIKHNIYTNDKIKLLRNIQNNTQHLKVVKNKHLVKTVANSNYTDRLVAHTVENQAKTNINSQTKDMLKYYFEKILVKTLKTNSHNNYIYNSNNKQIIVNDRISIQLDTNYINNITLNSINNISNNTILNNTKF